MSYSVCQASTCHHPEAVDCPLCRSTTGRADDRHSEPQLRTIQLRASLAFVQKPIMLITAAVGRDRQWNVSRIDNAKDIEGIFTPDYFTVVWTSQKSISDPAIARRLSNSHVLINCIPGASMMCSNKWQLQSCLEIHHSVKSNTSLLTDPYHDDTIPLLTYELQSISQADLDKLKASKPNSMWIMKPCTSSGHGGKGLRIFNSTAALEEFAVKSIFGADEPHSVVQEYIEDLMLLNGKKFDIRVPILISSTNPLTLYFHEGYLRIALNADSEGRLDVHLARTTTQLTTAGHSFTKRPETHFCWSFPMLQSYLNDHKAAGIPPDYVQNVLIPNIKRIAVQFIKSGIHLIDRSALSCYQLLGLDFSLSSDGHVCFIGANSYIAMRSDGWMRDFNYNLVADMLDIAIETRKRPKYFLSLSEGHWFGSWQLTWREELQPEPESVHVPSSDDKANGKDLKDLSPRLDVFNSPTPEIMEKISTNIRNDQPLVLCDVFDLLRGRAYDWDSIGRELNVPLGYRKELERKGVMTTDENKLESVLDKWMEFEHCPSWLTVLQAIKVQKYNELLGLEDILNRN